MDALAAVGTLSLFSEVAKFTSNLHHEISQLLIDKMSPVKWHDSVSDFSSELLSLTFMLAHLNSAVQDYGIQVLGNSKTQNLIDKIQVDILKIVQNGCELIEKQNHRGAKMFQYMELTESTRQN